MPAADASASYIAHAPLRFCDSTRTAYVVASGGSAATARLDAIDPAATIAVCNAFELVPNAAVIYAADLDWYHVHRGRLAGFAGERWCARLDYVPRLLSGQADEVQKRDALIRELRLQAMRGHVEDGLSRTPGVIHWGAGAGRNSALQAMALAWQWGARQIVLIGVDLGGTRFFGEHPPELGAARSDFAAHKASIERLVRDLVADGVAVVNLSPVSRIAGAVHPLQDVAPRNVQCMAVVDARRRYSGHRLARAFALGSGGGVSLGPQLRADCELFLFGDPELWPALQAARALGRTWYYADHGYIGRPAYFRITRNAYQHDGTSGRADFARLRALNVSPLPWRRAGRTVLLCPPDQAFTQLFGFDAATWRVQALAELQRHTDRPVVVRERACERPLAADLADAFVLVTWCSNAAVDALLAGVPVICTGQSAASPMGRARLADVESPIYPDNRHEWAARLAANQWTLNEIAAGDAWRHLQECA